MIPFAWIYTEQNNWRVYLKTFKAKLIRKDTWTQEIKRTLFN